MENKLFWDVRIVVSFKECSLKLHILVLEATKEQAENRAIKWAKEYAVGRIGKRIGHEVKIVGEPRAQAFKTSYTNII
jgi:hypothetical protein